MVGLIILGVIVALIVIICIVPVGADVAYEGGELRVSAKVAGVLLQLFPKKPVDETQPKKEKKPKKPKEPKPEKPKKPKKKPSFDFTRDELFELVKAVLRGFGRFGKVTVDRFLLHYTAAGYDPYNTAMTYNYVNAALSTLAPICRKKFTVKSSDVWTDVDFTKDWMELDIGVCMTIRPGQVLRMVFAIAFGALWILIKNKTRLLTERIKNRKNGKTNSGEAGPTAEAGGVIDIEENKTENIQAEERMDSNGE